jgi:hypothetical protein
MDARWLDGRLKGGHGEVLYVTVAGPDPASQQRRVCAAMTHDK